MVGQSDRGQHLCVGGASGVTETTTPKMVDPSGASQPSDARPTQGSRFAERLAAATGLGAAISAIDILVLRPTCSASEASGSCVYLFGGDASSIHGVSRLMATGKGMVNPVIYDLAGGAQVATASKPPTPIWLLTAATWLGSGPMAAVIVVAIMAIAGLWWVVSRYSTRRAALVTAELAIAVVVLLRLTGGESVTVHRAVGAAFALLAIPLAGLAGRRLAGDRAGVAVAVAMAVSPVIWVHGSLLNVEMTYVVVIAGLLASVLRAIDRRDVGSYALVALCLALAMQTRGEGVVLVPLVVVPLAWGHRDASALKRVGLVGGMAAATFAMTVPWSTYMGSQLPTAGNASAGLGSVLAVSSCDETFTGELAGWWFACADPPFITTTDVAQPLEQVVDDLVLVPGYTETVFRPGNPFREGFGQAPPVELFEGSERMEEIQTRVREWSGQTPDGLLGTGIWVNDRPATEPTQTVPAGSTVRVHFSVFTLGDEVRAYSGYQEQAMRYVGDHADELPRVVAIRIGRGLGLYRPNQTAQLDGFLEGRGPEWFTWTVQVTFWITVLVAAAGAREVRRLRRPLWPFGVLVAQAILAFAISFGLPRYRLGMDLALTVLAAVGCSELFRSRSTLSQVDDSATPSTSPEPVVETTPAPAPPEIGVP